MRLVLIICLAACSMVSFAQRQKIMLSDKDPYYLYVRDGDSTNLYYYQKVPQKPIKGVLVLFAGAGETTEGVLNQISLDEMAVEQGLLVIIPSYNWGTMQRMVDGDFLDTVFRDVVRRHGVSKNKFVFCGLSNGGVMAFTYAIQAVRDSNRYLQPAGIVGIDPPLDFARMYRYSVREITRDFSPAGVAEAKWLKNSYEQAYGGSPEENPSGYEMASVYSSQAAKGGNARYLTSIPIRMHSDLNLNFLLNDRHRDLYDWNGTDAVAFVNQLRLNGNQNADVIITRDKGQRPDGTMHPHSWHIADTEETLKWILKQVEGSIR